MNGEEYSDKTLSLRKVKKVDFKHPMRRQSLPLKLWAYDSSTITRPTEDLNVVKPSCLPGSNIKSRVGDAAITRSDVQVIAISPSRPGIGAPNNESAQRQLATPTMQVVESGNGMYGAVRDGENFENSDSGREPIAGEVSEATSASFFGLKRVNAQLVEWSWTEVSKRIKPRQYKLLCSQTNRKNNTHILIAWLRTTTISSSHLRTARGLVRIQHFQHLALAARERLHLCHTLARMIRRRAKIRKTHMAQGQEDTKEAWWTNWSKQWDEKATHSTEMLQPG